MMSCASSASRFVMPQPSVPGGLGLGPVLTLSAAPTAITFLAAPSDATVFAAEPPLPAAATSTISWFPEVPGCASRTSASNSWAIAVYAPPVLPPQEWFAMRAPFSYESLVSAVTVPIRPNAPLLHRKIFEAPSCARGATPRP